MTPRPAARMADGFTLLEILVALAVLGMLFVGLTQGVDFGLRAWAASGTSAGAAGSVDAADRAIRRLVEHLDASAPARLGPLPDGRPALGFTTELPAWSGEPALRRVRAVLLLDRARRLVLRWAPAPQGAPPPAELTRTAVLLDKVERLDLACWDDSGTPAWRGECDGAGRLRLVRLRLHFPKGDARSWPDIVAAPVATAFGR